MEKKSAVPEEVLQDLKDKATSTGLFMARGSKDLQRTTDRSISDEEMSTLLGSLDVIAEAIQEHGPKRQPNSQSTLQEFFDLGD